MRLISLALVATTFAAPLAMAGTKPFKSDLEKTSYAIGYDLGKNLQTESIDVSQEFVIKGIKDGLNKQAKALLTDAQLKNTLVDLNTQLLEKQNEQRASQAMKNKAEGEAFLAQNKSRQDVKSTPSGLQYRVVQSGTGAGRHPNPTDTVITHYQGRLIDGTEFDSSYKRGEPVEFPLNAVIPGWTEALQLMKPGDKFEIFIPSELGYGEQGVGRIIGPNATLIFDIELLEVK